MQAAALIPAPDAIPVAAGWLEGLLILTFAAHILLVNSVLGGAVVCSVRSVVSKNSLPIKHMAKVLPSLFALAVNFGVAPLLFIQMLYGQYLYTSSVLMAVYWLSVVFLAIAAYYALYIFAGRYGSHIKFSLSIVISTVAMLCIGLVMSNNMTLMLRPDVWAAYFAFFLWIYGLLCEFNTRKFKALCFSIVYDMVLLTKYLRHIMPIDCLHSIINEV